MSTRMITECDRCKREVRGGEVKNLTSITVGEKTADLCAGCGSSLQEFLDGRSLDVPP